ncbi:MAG: rhodanese-like domain-containing protein, partial [Candidatus Puniceispirillaceae bacterium]
MSRGLFASLYEAGRPFALIDTRERRDHVDGHWFGSTNIPLSVLTTGITRMVPDRDFPVHLLDWQDAASNAAAQRLSQLGYASVAHCPTSHPGGFGEGFVKGEYVWSKAFGEVLAHRCGLPEVTPSEYLQHHRDALLFDVRPTAEYRQFTIPGSQSLPNSLLLANMEALKASGRTALLHCAGRTRSIIGACTLKAAGYGAPFAIFKGGTQAWQLDGHDREHQAGRVFAGDTDNPAAARAFLDKWNIPFDRVDPGDISPFVEAHRGRLLFDVSDDAARGRPMEHGILKLSGTNLIQQTDQAVARYHVPVVLFDHGSGSRAAFAAYWLRAMGFSVQVALLDGRLDEAPAPDTGQIETPFPVLAADELTAHRNHSGPVLDFRSSAAFRAASLTGSSWLNVSACLSGSP